MNQNGLVALHGFLLIEYFCSAICFQGKGCSQEMGVDGTSV